MVMTNLGWTPPEEADLEASIVTNDPYSPVRDAGDGPDVG